MKIDLDTIVVNFLTAIYKEDIFKKTLALKGGQAIRFAEKIKTRESMDIDLSATGELKDFESFFKKMEEVLSEQFKSIGLHLIHFNATRRPEVQRSGMPDFWRGWSVEFKLLENKHIKAKPERQGALAVIPEGFASNKIEIDISEYEYCGALETVKVKSVRVTVYSRALIILEKLRSLCQQHPNYKYHTKTKPRARDFYDIDLLYAKSIREDNVESLISNCKKHIKEVFNAKEVDLDVLKNVFEDDYLSILRSTWESVVDTVNRDVEEFDYYVNSTKFLVDKINS